MFPPNPECMYRSLRMSHYRGVCTCLQIRFMYQHAPATCPDICSKRVRGYVVRDFDTVFRIQNVGGLDEDAFWYLLHYGAAQQAYADHARTLNCTEEDYDPGYNTARDKTLPQNWPSGQPPPRLPSPSREFFDRRRLPLPPDEFFDERRRSSQGKDSPPPDQSSFSPAKVQQIDDRQQRISHPTPNEKNYKPPWSRILRGIKIPSPNIARLLRAVNNVNTGRHRPVASFARPPPLLPFP